MATVRNNFVIRKLLDAGDKIDSADKAGILTKAGRAAQKHDSRPNSAFFRVRGSTLEKNAQGRKILKEIITNLQRKIVRFSDGRLRVYHPDGRGASYSSDGSFRGFLEPRI